VTSNRRTTPAGAGGIRIGFHGRLGSGNLGNDGTFEVVLDALRSRHPDAVFDALVSGPEVVALRYGIPARQLHWLHAETAHRRPPPFVVRAARIGWGAVVDAWRTFRWVRAHDVVVVPGMGSLETTLPVRPWQLPWALFVLGVAGRLTGTRVAYLAVGASAMAAGPTRWLLVTAARLAHYRSFRDGYSRHRMGDLGVGVEDDPVYPDLVFGLPSPRRSGPTYAGAVGVGVIELGQADARSGARDRYLRLITDFVLHLVDQGRPVALLIGDGDDATVARHVLADVRASRPRLPATALCFEPAVTLAELARQVDRVGSVVASRFHNVICGLRAGRPTIALGYADKHRVLMEEVGTPELARSLEDVAVDELVELFADMEARRTEISAGLQRHTARLAALVERQIDDVDALLDASVRAASAKGGPT
jgi:polysaccharide pyruvyl transferase WcaK-like protein